MISCILNSVYRYTSFSGVPSEFNLLSSFVPEPVKLCTNVADPLSNQDVATKNYVHKNAFTTAGGVASGDIELNVGSDLVRSLGCNNLTTCKFTLLQGTDTYMLSYSLPDSQLPVPVKIKTDGVFSS